MKDLIKVGVLTRAHGIRGKIIVRLENSESKVIGKNTNAIIEGQEGARQSILIDEVSYGNFVIIKINGINDRTEAEKINGCDLFLKRDYIHSNLKNDEFLLNDLLNFTVYDEEENEIGIVSGFSSNNAQDIVSVKNKSGELLDLLLISEFIIDIDFENCSMKLKIPEGT